MRGPTSAYLLGRRLDQVSGGSTTWSSTETILGNSLIPRRYPKPDGVAGVGRFAGVLPTCARAPGAESGVRSRAAASVWQVGRLRKIGCIERPDVTR